MAIIPRLSAPLDVVVEDETSGYGECGGCSVTWTGHQICHCATCHLTFTAVGGFDTHRRGGRCWTPEELRAHGLEPDENSHWRKPMPADVRAQRFTDTTNPER